VLEAKGIRSKGLALNTSTDIHIKVSAIKNGSRPKTAEWLEAFAETAFALRSKPKLDNPVKLEFGRRVRRTLTERALVEANKHHRIARQNQGALKRWEGG